MTEEMSMELASTPHPDFKMVHTRMRMVDLVQQGMLGLPEDNTLNEFGLMILNIEGVVGCVMHPYTIQVQKAAMFAWGEIEPELKKLLKMFLKSQKELRRVSDEIAAERKG